MKKLENISAQDKKLPFTVPAGYFENLQERVMQRCDEHVAEEKKHLSLWGAIRPQLAFAAGFALLVGIATMAVKFTTTTTPQATADISLSTYEISMFDIETYVEQTVAVEDVVDDQAIVEYLLCDNHVGYLAGYSETF